MFTWGHILSMSYLLVKRCNISTYPTASDDEMLRKRRNCIDQWRSRHQQILNREPAPRMCVGGWSHAGTFVLLLLGDNFFSSGSCWRMKLSPFRCKLYPGGCLRLFRLSSNKLNFVNVYGLRQNLIKHLSYADLVCKESF